MNQSEEFLRLLTDSQGRLFAYIAAAFGDFDRANEVLQETNLVMWRKSDEFEMGSNFNAWSMRIANFQIMSYRQRHLRDKLLFDQALVDQIAQRAQERSESYATRMKQLDSCINKMPIRYRDVITRRYHHGESLQEIGEGLKQTPNAIGQLLFRVKKKLFECVSQGVREATIDVT
ncbi:MAG: sigma-70 family RNA polymerase sigma factor [Rubripirellula sp.]